MEVRNGEATRKASKLTDSENHLRDDKDETRGVVEHYQRRDNLRRTTTLTCVREGGIIQVLILSVLDYVRLSPSTHGEHNGLLRACLIVIVPHAAAALGLTRGIYLIGSCYLPITLNSKKRLRVLSNDA